MPRLSGSCLGSKLVLSYSRWSEVRRILRVDAVPILRGVLGVLGATMEFYGEEFLRMSRYTYMKKLYAYHEEKHGFPEMGDHGPDPFILLKAVASNDLWTWHAFFGVSGMNNDMNVLRQSPLFNDLKSGKAPCGN
ncbi:ALP1-like protein [Tanacetum coccineum]